MRAKCLSSKTEVRRRNWWNIRGIKETEVLSLTEGKTYQVYPSLRHIVADNKNMLVFLVINDVGKLRMFPQALFTKPWEEGRGKSVVTFDESNENNTDPIEPGPSRQEKMW